MGTQTATILVSDLVGSTELRAALGEDRAEEVRRLHDRALVDVAERAGGTVVKGLGDGVLVQFAGAAEAVGAAVGMQQAVETLGRREKLSLAIRVGLSSGDVTIEDGDCFGVPVVEAARLCAAAGDGEVLAAEVVTVLARGRGGHALDEVGSMDLKGLPDPVVVHRVGWAPVRAAADLRATAPYVGRDDERRVLRERFDAAAAGAGGLVLVAGEPGIGKTRLVTELCREVAADPGATVLVGGCHDGEVAAFAPFVEAIGDWARSTPSVTVADVLGPEAPVVARLVPAVHDVLPDTTDPVDLPPAEADARLHDALGRVLERMARERPVILVLDDLHWADTATVGLLRVVSRKATALPVLVIGTYRDTDLDRRHPLAEALALLRREVEPTRLALDGLSPVSVRDLLERLADHEVPEAFASMLATQTDGNPFFLREMLIHLSDIGALRFEDGTWVAAEDIAAVIPEGVREVVGRRLSQLSEASQKLLSAGALFEVAFPLEVAAEVAGLGEGEALDAVDEVLAAQVVLATDAFDHYAFSHALFRQTLVAELNPSRQVRAHRAIAEALDKRLLAQPTPTEAAALARHWYLSAALPGAERGVPAALVLAADARARYAHREAFDALTVAAELLPDGDERVEEVHRARAEAGIRARVDLTEVVADTDAMARAAANRSGPTTAADAVGDVAVGAWAAGDRRAAWAVAGCGWRWLAPERRDLTWARLRQAELEEAEFTDPDHPGLPLDDDDRRELHAVVDRLRADGADMTGFTFVYASRAAALEHLARPDAEQDASTFMAAWVAGDYHAAIRRAQEHAPDPEQEPHAAAMVGTLHARCLAVTGDHGGADTTLATAADLLPRIPETSNAAFQVLGAHSLIGYVRGRPALVPELDQLRALTASPDTRWASLAVAAASAATLARAGDAATVPLVDAAMVGVVRAPAYAGNYALIAALCAEALWLLDRSDHLADLEANLRAKVIEPDVRYAEVVGPLAMARLCALDGRAAEARDWVEAAHALVAEQRTPVLGPPIHEFEAEWELRLGADGDPERCRAAIAAGRAAAADPAMAPWLDRLAALEARSAAAWP